MIKCAAVLQKVTAETEISHTEYDKSRTRIEV
jgi:hypothetical protein